MKTAKTILLAIMMLSVFCSYGFAAEKISDEMQILRITAESMKSASVMFTATQVDEIVKKKGADYAIVSLQTPQEYAAGHVPGALRIDFDLKNIKDSLNKLPKNKKLILVSSNGQEACKVNLILRQLGFDSGFMMLGMNAYNRLYAGKGAYAGNVGGEISMENTNFSPVSNTPAYSGISGDELVIKSTETYAEKNKVFDITAYDLPAIGDVFLISMQSAEDYAKGHIPGTINIPGADFLGGDERLLHLPKNRKIVVTCYIGHYSSMGAMMLNQLGYDAYSLQWGAAGWNLNLAKKIEPLITKGMNLEIEKQ